MKRTVLITGGAGFIGSHVVRLFVTKYPHYKIVNLDKLTYAGNLANLKDIESRTNYQFVRGDICDADFIEKLFSEYNFDSVIHLAAESHVDRSISNPMEFVNTNVIGTVTLLNAARKNWSRTQINYKQENHYQEFLCAGAVGNGQASSHRPSVRNLFYHVSTDEVYGSLGKKGKFKETTPYDPHSPYSASKASSDHFVRAYHNTFQLPVVISNCSNNYGPFQFPEKLIPLAINNIKNNKPVPVYGKGENVRDWLFVEDHAKAIDLIFHRGKIGETYNIGGNNQWKNIALLRLLCKIMDKKLGRKKGESEKLITFVKDRAGHDLRYAIDSSKIQKELKWKPSVTFQTGLERTVDWYLQNEQWLRNVTSGEYQKYYQEQYEKR